ncbi:MAG: putative toxin-antitoxin system toxin component, PIN family, partial [Bryobacteraceae bacterium]
MKPLRIVLDTNVLISAAVKPLGLQALVINVVAFRAVQLFVSEPILAEYREVFSRPKFARLPPAEVATLLALIESEATIVTPNIRLEISKHDSDNRFYECADAAQADYIVTGNTRHFTKP